MTPSRPAARAHASSSVLLAAKHAGWKCGPPRTWMTRLRAVIGWYGMEALSAQVREERILAH